MKVQGLGFEVKDDTGQGNIICWYCYNISGLSWVELVGLYNVNVNVVNYKKHRHFSLSLGGQNIIP